VIVADILAAADIVDQSLLFRAIVGLATLIALVVISYRQMRQRLVVNAQRDKFEQWLKATPSTKLPEQLTRNYLAESETKARAQASKEAALLAKYGYRRLSESGNTADGSAAGAITVVYARDGS
jgi:hypothetical protein